MRSIILGTLLLSWSAAHAAWIPIYGADTAPSTPAVSDAITIQAYGDVSGSAWFISGANTVITPGAVVLNLIFQDGGIGTPTVTPWTHNEPIGTLGAGSYDLTVNTWHGGVVQDTLRTPFEVIPEPASVGLLGTAALAAFLARAQTTRPRRRRTAGGSR